MATDFTEEGAADAVVESFASTPDERLRTILNSLVRHLHAAVREVEPSIAEWEQAIEFLTATGQKCTDVRQEFILLSDVLGISMLVETINERGAAGATQSTVLGPFHMTKSPRRELGDTIDLIGESEPCVVTGRVVATDSTPLPGAVLDVWQANDHGAYDVQEPGKQPAGNGRGLFTADGYRPLTTHIFVADSPYIDSDAVFAVKKSLITEFTEVDDPEQAARYQVSNPFRRADVQIVLSAA